MCTRARSTVTLGRSRIAGLGSCGAPAQPTASPTRAALVLDVEASERGHALVIGNQSGSTQRFRREITVEHQAAGGSWEPVSASMLFLRERCDAPGGGLFEPPACVDIPDATTFRAAPWTDMIGDAQCACEECGDAGPGTYRFAILPCEGAGRSETAAFTVE